MQTKQKFYIWAAIAAAIIFCLYIFSPILLPFVFAAVVAYFLDPVVDRVEEYGFSRTTATFTILISFVVVLVAVMLTIGPIFIEQFSKLAMNIPVYLSDLQENHGDKLKFLIDDLDGDVKKKVQEFTYKFSMQIIQASSVILQSLVTSGAAVVNFLSLLAISPIIAFYLLRDWDLVIKKIDELLPRGNLVAIRKEFQKIDQIISSYIRGQVTVCIIMAAFYALNLSYVAGLDYGIAIGTLTGILSFIPYLGMAIGMIVGTLVAYFQFGLGDGLLITLIVFIVGNVIEGNLITPKLVGDRVNVHPAWIIFALMAGGSIMGFTGVLLAIPIAAVLGVLIRT